MAVERLQHNSKKLQITITCPWPKIDQKCVHGFEVQEWVASASHDVMIDPVRTKLLELVLLPVDHGHAYYMFTQC